LIIDQADAAKDVGAVGALLRREGLYSDGVIACVYKRWGETTVGSAEVNEARSRRTALSERNPKTLGWKAKPAWCPDNVLHSAGLFVAGEKTRNCSITTTGIY
jgi:hypothetical protein